MGRFQNFLIRQTIPSTLIEQINCLCVQILQATCINLLFAIENSSAYRLQFVPINLDDFLSIFWGKSNSDARIWHYSERIQNVAEFEISSDLERRSNWPFGRKFKNIQVNLKWWLLDRIEATTWINGWNIDTSKFMQIYWNAHSQ